MLHPGNQLKNTDIGIDAFKTGYITEVDRALNELVLVNSFKLIR